MSEPVSRHEIKSRPSAIEFWTTTIGDAGVLFYGHARIGVHSFKTESYYGSRTAAKVAAIGLAAAHVAGVGVTYEGREIVDGTRVYDHAQDCPCAACRKPRRVATKKKRSKRA